jgi:hypothetical protein
LRSGRKGRQFESAHPDTIFPLSTLDAVEHTFYHGLVNDVPGAGPLKRCGRCAEFKPVSSFHRRGDRHQWCCKKCRKEWDAIYWARRREFRVHRQRARRRQLRAWIGELKRSQPCTDCGGYFHWVAMAYDHLPGNQKRAEVSNLVASGYRSVLVGELAKCELVCANCHAVRTYQRRQGDAVGQPIVEDGFLDNAQLASASLPMARSCGS